jgi:hypothetical protein
MNLTQEIYPHLEQIPWLSEIGQVSTAQFDFPATYVENSEAALSWFNSNLWADVKTEAQGDLTGYLSQHHYDAYGGHWNILAKQSRSLVEKVVKTKLTEALIMKALPVEMLQAILVDINRAALEITYRKQFPRAPQFFERLLKIYEVGRLPCGWNGGWPVGNVVVY